MRMSSAAWAKKFTVLKLVLTTLAAIFALALTSCKNGPSQVLYPKGHSVLMQQNVGRTFTLAYVSDSPQWPQGTVQKGAMTLDIYSNSEIKGSFTCQYNGSAIPATYWANVQWGTNNIVSITNLHSLPTDCPLDKYFTFESVMQYDPPSFVGLQLTSTTTGMKAEFVPWN